MSIDFKQDVEAKNFDWQDMATKQLAIFINVSIEDSGTANIVKNDILDSIQECIRVCKSSEKLEREILERCFNLLGKISKNEVASQKVLRQKTTLFKTLLFFHREFSGDLQMNCLRTLHPLLKMEDFRKVCLEEHKFTLSIFEVFIKEAVYLF